MLFTKSPMVRLLMSHNTLLKGSRSMLIYMKQSPNLLRPLTHPSSSHSMSRGLLRSTMIPARGLASQSEPYDLAVLGGGPGGYVAAVKASQLGLKVGYSFAFPLLCLVGVRREWDSAARPGVLAAKTIGQLTFLDCLYRQARYPRRNMSQCRMYPIQGHV